ncbi:MAG: putative lipopolysaccharide heptosyltransferase III [Verrucomicrobiae bacterium]|nr:putative lipopolysaccharide heptosyltransferase III [Verrucomicrobiae bacterium]
MTLENIKRIAILKFRNIGDALMVSAVLPGLRRAFPGCHITVAVNEGTEAMLDLNPHVDQLLVLRRKGAWISRAVSEWTLLRTMLTGRYDLVIDYTTGDRPAFYSAMSLAPVRTAWNTRPWKETWKSMAYTHYPDLPSGQRHEVLRHTELLAPLGLRFEKPALEFHFSPEDRAWAQNLVLPHAGKMLVHVHPVSRWLFKCWEDQKMAEVIDRLQETDNARVLVTSSGEPRELRRAENILALCRTQPVSLLGRTSLHRLGALSSVCDLFLGVDSAPMHMAAAVGVPVIALFGPSGAESWHPWCENRQVLHKGCPCNEDKTHPACPHDAIRDCMKAIHVGEVLEAVRALRPGTVPKLMA